MTWQGGLDLRCVFEDRAWKDFAGRPAGPDRGAGWTEQVHPEDRISCLETSRARFEARLPFTMVYRFQRPDGAYRWLVDRGAPRHGPGGEFLGYAGTCIDLDDLAKAEEARRASERRARAVLNSLADQIAVLDGAGTILAVNRAWRDFAATAGAGGAAHEGVNYLDVCRAVRGEAEAEAAEFAAGLGAVLEGRIDSFSSGYACDTPEGPRWFSARVTSFSGDGPGGAVVAHVDVTEARRNEEALRRYAARIEVLRAMDRAILSSGSPLEIAGAALTHLERLVPCWSVVASLLHFDRDEVEILGSLGPLREWYPPGTRSTYDLRRTAQVQELRLGRTVVERGPDFPDATSPVLRALRARGLRSYVLTPLLDRGTVVGVLMACADRADAYGEAEIEVIRQVADQLAIAVQRAILFEEVRATGARLESISRRLIGAEEEERRRIARELHDETGQGLLAIRMDLRALLRGPAAPGRLEDCLELVDRTIAQVRTLSLALRPSLLDDFGLVPALRSLCNRLADRAGIAIAFVADAEIARCDSEVETACYRVAQEALNNVAKHSGAPAARVRLSRGASGLDLLVADDGAGFDVGAATARAAHGSSLGMLGMRERAALVGGSLAVNSGPGRGTEVRASFPLKPPERGAP